MAEDSLLDQDYLASLEDNPPYTTQTIAFVKSVLQGLHFVHATPAGGVVTCQLKKGDGTNLTATTDVSLKSHSATIVVNSGTAMRGAGTSFCWVRSTSSGTFQVTVNGTGNILLEIIPHRGVAIMVPLAL
jgi:hypothetical protein